MKSNRMKDAFENIARHGVAKHPNLWPRISARIEEKPLMRPLRAHPFVATLIALLIVLALSSAAYALGRIFGYIPGIGLIDQSAPVRILAEPISLNNQGINITISRVVADSTRTFISYHVDGIPAIENEIPSCIGIPEMRLSNGGTLEIMGGVDGVPVMRNGDFMSYIAEYVYSPIPIGTTHVTFVLPCVLTGGNELENWEVLIPLSPAPLNLVTPVVEIDTTYSASGPTVAITSALDFSTPAVNELSTTSTSAPALRSSGLSLEKVLDIADSYILIGKFTDAGDLPGPLYMSTASDSEYLPRIEDANGNPVSFTVREDLRPDPDWDVAYYWAYEIPKSVVGPLKLTIDSIKIREYNASQFRLSVGENPQIGQEWHLNQQVKLGSSEFVVESATFIGDGYTFYLSSDNLPEGVTPNLDVLDSSSDFYLFENINSMVDNSGSKTIATITITTQSTPPAGTLMLNWWMEEYIPQAGPWSLTWMPSKATP